MREAQGHHHGLKLNGLTHVISNISLLYQLYPISAMFKTIQVLNYSLLSV